MKTAAVLLICLGIVSCSPDNNRHRKESFPIDGKWYPNDFRTSYLSLTFGKEEVFDTIGDTINGFRYFMDYPTRTLWLTDAFNQTRSATILKLDADSLIFNQLWDLKTVQRFHRAKTK